MLLASVEVGKPGAGSGANSSGVSACGVHAVTAAVEVHVVHHQVALPSLQLDLGIAAVDLPWAVNAYTLVFAGFLLLGGRLANLHGRWRVFLAGLGLFTGASLLCCLACSALPGPGSASARPCSPRPP